MENNEPVQKTGVPPRQRNLSARYGQSDTANLATGPVEDDVIPAINLKHPVFLLISSVGFAALYTEVLFFAATYYGNSLGTGLNIALMAGVFLLTFGVMYTSFTLPHRQYRSRFNNYSPIIFLATQWTMAIMMILAVTGLAFVAGIFLVDGKLDAVGELLRSYALYSIVAMIVIHGLVIIVRYIRFLYEREMHESYKIVSLTGVLAVVILVVTLFLFQFDLGRMGGNLPNQGWLALHLSIRDITLIGLTFFAFLWHGTALADH
ncbi:MAG: hypothetical protein JWP00_4911 [Chloroflexi bacterium]|nr:hypothetical protein [Chloroflexota bacterium]